MVIIMRMMTSILTGLTIAITSLLPLKDNHVHTVETVVSTVNICTEQIRENYECVYDKKDNPGWLPLAVLDDEIDTYILFPKVFRNDPDIKIIDDNGYELQAVTIMEYQSRMKMIKGLHEDFTILKNGKYIRIQKMPKQPDSHR
jgi:hypothetical protein